jgi:phosphoglycolate phosphatase-like HAD superfamily hydrolase
MRIEPVFVFDLDGTLVDSVYEHVLAWKEVLDAEGIDLSVWRIHRKIGMSGGLLANQLLRETGVEIAAGLVERLRQRHDAVYQRRLGIVRLLPGARELLSWLSDNEIPWAIATSGRVESAGPALQALGIDPDRRPVVTSDQVKHAKPDPDLFIAAAERLGAPIQSAVVVGPPISYATSTRSEDGGDAKMEGKADAKASPDKCVEPQGRSGQVFTLALAFPCRYGLRAFSPSQASAAGER